MYLVNAQVMVYTGRLAVKAMHADCTKQIRNLVDWCEAFFQDNFVDQWIQANGGWVSYSYYIISSSQSSQPAK